MPIKVDRTIHSHWLVAAVIRVTAIRFDELDLPIIILAMSSSLGPGVV